MYGEVPPVIATCKLVLAPEHIVAVPDNTAAVDTVQGVITVQSVFVKFVIPFTVVTLGLPVEVEPVEPTQEDPL